MTLYVHREVREEVTKLFKSIEACNKRITAIDGAERVPLCKRRQAMKLAIQERFVLQDRLKDYFEKGFIHQIHES